MIHQPGYTRQLLKKHIEDKAEARDKALLQLALDLYETEELVELLETGGEEIQFPSHPVLQKLSADTIIRRSRKERQPGIKKSLVKRLIIASLIVLVATCIAVLAWLWRKPDPRPAACDPAQWGDHTLPGINRGRLRLANGSILILDSNKPGPVARQGNIIIEKTTAGSLVYQLSGKHEEHSDTLFNIVTSSAGSLYRIILSDGSMLLLNAQSSVRFPVSFTDTARTIEITGEAFVDVKSSPASPFYIIAGDMRIRLEQGQLNVNTFLQTPVATVVSGLVDLTAAGDTIRLASGEEALINCKDSNGNITGSCKRNADLVSVISWQSGFRLYNRTNARDFLGDMARWYDLEFVNIECVKDRYFTGMVCYSMPLDELLWTIRANGMEFRQEGRRIVFCSR